MTHTNITIVPFDSPAYEQTKTFREQILRIPLGLSLSKDDLVGEASQIHIAATDSSNTVIGTVLLKPLTKDAIKLRQMAVAEQAQGAGLGKKLILFAEQIAQEHQFITIEMHARIIALGFYEKLGYVTEGDAFIEVTVPTIKMTKNLPHNLMA